MGSVLDNLVFSITVVFPTFVLVFLGYLAARLHVVDRAFTSKLNRICFTYFLSVRLYLDITSTGLESLKNWKLSGFVLAATLLVYALLWAVARRFVKPRENVGTFVHVGFRSSFTVLGLSMVRNMAGEDGVAHCAGILALAAILYNILAVLCFIGNNREQSRTDVVKGALRKIATNPLIIAVVLAILSELCSFSLPALMRSPLETLAGAAVPISLLCVGAALDIQSLRSCGKTAVLAAVTKTFLQAILVLPFAVFCGFRGVELAALSILFTTANPSACYVMTESMGGNSSLAAASVVFSTLLSVFSTTLGLYVLRSLGFI